MTSSSRKTAARMYVLRPVVSRDSRATRAQMAHDMKAPVFQGLLQVNSVVRVVCKKQGGSARSLALIQHRSLAMSQGEHPYSYFCCVARLDFLSSSWTIPVLAISSASCLPAIFVASPSRISICFFYAVTCPQLTKSSWPCRIYG